MSYNISNLIDSKSLKEAKKTDASTVHSTSSRQLDFSLFYFSSNDAKFTFNKYKLLMEGSKYADRNGFKAIWIPERHFHAFGGLYPNPSVLAAAVAMITENVRLRAGSVVIPLHHPVRVAEEWSIVDNLSNGRVDLAFARGWNPNDFVIAPENYQERLKIMYGHIETVKKLWKGESIQLINGVGKEVAVNVFPLPQQPELNIWVTCTSGKDGFIEAGKAGLNILTALLFQPIEDLKEKIQLYKEARAENNFDPEGGHVTLMLHTYIGEEEEQVKKIVRKPFTEYLRTSVDLWRHGMKGLNDLSKEGLDDLLDIAFERYYNTSALLGTPQSCNKMVEDLQAAGVNEIACLVDFGVENNLVINGLSSIKKLMMLHAPDHMRPFAEVDKLLNSILPEEKTENGNQKLLAEEKSLLLKELLQKKSKGENTLYRPSAGQRALWFIYLNDKSSSAYNQGFSFRIEGNINTEALTKAFQSVIDRHEALRTTFVVQKEEQMIQVHAPQKFHIEEIDVTGINEDDLHSKVKANYHTPFDLEKGPLLKVYLFRLSEKKAVLLINIHHIITDGQSLIHLLKEFKLFYEAEIKNIPVNLPVLKHTFHDFEKHQRALLDGPKGDELWDYWKKQLEGELPVLDLPLDKARPVNQTFNGASVYLNLDEEFTHRLKAYTEKEATTIYITLLTAFQVLLYKYTGQNDLLVGTPLTNRNRPEFRQLIGYFVNLAVIRANVKDNNTFAEILQSTKEAVLQALDHSEFPFASIVERLLPNRDLSRHPLFQVSFVLQSFRNEEDLGELFMHHKNDKVIEWPGLSVQPFELSTEEGHVDLNLEIVEGKNRMMAVFKYNQDLFEESTVMRIAHHYQNLLNSILSYETLPIKEVQLLSEGEREQILEEFNSTFVAFQSKGTLQELFEKQVEKTPENIAIVLDNQKLTYREINEKANKLAHYLQSNCAVKPKDKVGISLERSQWMIISLLAVLKAGAAYVPIDPELPESRIQFMLEDAAIKVLLSGDIRSITPTNELVILSINEKWEEISTYSEHNPEHVNQLTDLAYVIYTSGSTGVPKGVMIEHGNALNTILDHAEKFSVTEKDKVLQFASLSFDVSVFEIFMTLVTGATSVLIKKNIISDTEEFATYIKKNEISILVLTPSYLNTLPIDVISSIRVIVTGGEAPDIEQAAFYSQFCEYYNAYGPTECSICATTYKVNPQDKDKICIPIGRPISNTQMYILDDENLLLPVGVPGEICIAGAGVARGYLNNEDLSSCKFIPNPFGDGKLYKTGDRGKWLADGNIEFLGRKDGQVKIRGHRIELDEIEAVLTKHPSIDQAIVNPVKDKNEVYELIAYYVSTGKLSLREIRKYLEERLPIYMMPSSFIHLTSLPLTVNGKVDRKALPQPQQLSSADPGNYIAPNSPLEAQLVKIWEEILERETIGVQQNFFEIGGHSLKATKLISEIQKAFHVRIDIKDIFTQPTVEKLSKIIIRSSKVDYEGITPLEQEAYYELSHAQKRLWLLQELVENQIAYNLPAAFVLEGTLNKEAFEKAFYSIVSRHESLRTIFPVIEGEPRQKILPIDTIQFNVDYFDFLEESNLDDRINEFVKREATIIFNLEEGPLFKVKLLRTEEEKHLLLLTVHHIIFDARSMEVLVQELIFLYNQYKKGETKMLPALPIQYKEYATWQNKEIKKQLYKYQSYWWNRFNDSIPVLNLPLDYSRPSIKTYNGRQMSLKLEDSLQKGLQQVSQKHGASIFMTFLAAINTLFYRYTGQEDIILGVPFGGREHADLDDQIGFYINTTALRTTFSGIESFENLLQNVKEQTLQAYEYQYYPIDQLIEDLQVTTNRSRSPLFDVVVSYQKSNIETFDLEYLDGLSVRPYQKEITFSKFDLAINLVESSGSLQIIAEYNVDLFKSTRIERLLNHVVMLLSSVVKKSDEKLCNLKFLTPTEEIQLALGFNKAADFPGNYTIQEIVELNAATKPHATAVKFEDKVLTYRQLNQQSNQLAHYLRNNFNTRPDEIIGLMMDRSELPIVAILGILKSGAAYLPIDPTYPQERIRFICEDARIKTLITNQAQAFKDILLEGCQVVVPEEIEEQLSKYSTFNPDKINSSKDLAYIIYTSGSTGAPKGVMIEHKGFVNMVLEQIREFNIEEKDNVLQFASMSFDASLSEIFMALFSGAALTIIKKEIIDNIEGCIHYCRNQEVTVATFPPSYLGMFELDQLSFLRVLITAGESANAEKARHCSKFLDYYNAYGPTECSVCVSIHKADPFNDSLSVPIGRPISNLNVYILDQNDQLLPIGVDGEICVSGPGLSRGYLYNDELTSDKFKTILLPDPQRIYKTGDIGRWLENGEIEFSGRKDHQVKIRGYRVEPGEVRNILSGFRGLDDAVVTALKDQSGSMQLMAYYTGQNEVKSEDLRAYMANRLPEYMIPSCFIPIASIPLTTHGKIDLNRLPQPVDVYQQRTKNFIAPSNKMEKHLAEVFEDVLGRKPIGVNDSFFELGGDSIKAIQITSRLYQKGYKLTAKDIFKYLNISSIAQKVEALTRAVDQSAVAGDIPLTPIQREFFKTPRENSSHYNQAVMLSFTEQFDKATIEAVFAKIQGHHDALRMVYKKENEIIIQQNIDLIYPLSLDIYDLKGKEKEQEALNEYIIAIQTSIDLEHGPMMKLGLFHLSDGDKLIVVIHHLVIDGISWRILFEDIERLLEQHKSGVELSLPLKTDSFQSWSEKLSEYANSEDFLKEKYFWTSLESKQILALPVNNFPGSNLVKDTFLLSFTLSQQDTEFLLTQSNKAFHTEINDLLLAALSISYCKSFKSSQMLIALEGHGREEILEKTDISRTIGWFTSVFPVLFNINSIEDISRQIIEIKETLRNVPNKGIGYGILNYLTYPSNKAELQFNLRPQISFNYLGQLESEHQNNFFTWSQDLTGDTQDASNERDFLLDFSGIVKERKLSIKLSYNKHQFEKETMEAFCCAYETALKAVIHHCINQKGRTLTPSDLTYKSLSIEKLSRLTDQWEIEDIYQLSPMQEAMLFYSLLDKSSLAYFQQISFTLKEHFNPEHIKDSLNDLAKRHEVLRTKVVQDEKGFLQVVLNKQEIPFHFEDLRNEKNPSLYMKEYKEKDKARSFDLTNDPLFRVAAFQTSENEFSVIWSFHHILMDGWCFPVVISEFLELYKSLAIQVKPKLQNPVPYKQYIQWLEKQDQGQAKKYWGQYLKDFEKPTSLPKSCSANKSNGYKNIQVMLELDSEVSKSLNHLAGKYNSTLNVLFQAIWGIILGKYNNTKDVVFGAVVSGRPPEIENVEKMVGLFINTIPIRINYNPQTSFSDLLKKRMEENMEAESHHYCPLAEIQSETPIKNDLIDHVLIFENYPMDDHLMNTLSDLSAHEQSNYDFNLLIAPGASIKILFAFNENVYSKWFIETLKERVAYIIRQVIEKENSSIAELIYVTPNEQSFLLDTLNRTNVAYPSEATIQELFEIQVSKTPNSKAIIFEDKVLTYQELNEKANQLAHYLRTQYQIKPDCLIGLMAGRTERVIIAILGILKAGGAYLPIDPTYPEDRIRYILKDANVKVLLTESEYMFQLDYYTDHLFALDIQLEDLKERKDNPIPVNKSNDLAYVIYTSGSTGQPKGVMIEHRSNVNMSLSQVKEFAIEPEDRILQFASLSFDASVYEIFMALYAGAALVLVRQEVIGQSDRFISYIKEKDVSIVTLPPAYLTILPVDELRFLRVIITAGESPNIAYAAQCSQFSDYYNAYGTTECAVCISSYKVSLSDKLKKRMPIGGPISNTELYILDSRGALVPLGAEGEIGVSGAGLARGYLNNEELTASKFIPHPFKAGERLYLSGDLGRWLEDGNLEFIGRKDEQVKLRGYRIEPGEISHVIQTHTGVEDAHVFVDEDKTGEKMLVAVFTGNGKSAYTLKQLKKLEDENFNLLPDKYELPNGMVIFLKNKGETDLIYKEIFEEKSYFHHGIHLNAGDVVIDIGANVGLFSLYVGTAFKGVKVYAFEPLSPIYQYLTANINLYDVDVTTFNYGISDKESSASFTYYPNNTAISGRYGNKEEEQLVVRNYMLHKMEEQGIEVDEIQLNNLLADRMEAQNFECQLRNLSVVMQEQKINRVDLLKIDVEKSELDVLMGISKDDWSKIRQVVVEVHDREDHLAQITRMLQENGFKIFVDQEEDLRETNIYNVYGVRKDNGAVILPICEPTFNKEGNWVNTQDLINDIRTWCHKRLPDYMVPGQFKLVEKIPLTAHGKIDKRSLKALEGLKLISDEEGIAPKNNVETKLVKIWKEVLGKEKISTRDNFFQIGGHSLKATQLVSRIHQTFNTKIELSSIFSHPTIEELAILLSFSRATDYKSIPIIDHQDYYELSPAQKRLWLSDQQEKNSLAYIIPGACILQGPLDKEAFIKSFKTIVSRHESLRTTFISIEGQPKQKIHQEYDFEVTFIDLRGKEDKEAQAKALSVIEASTAFNLAVGPLLRVQLLQLEEDQYILLCTMHHIIADGWSVDILWRELKAIYQSFVNKDLNPLPPLPIQYKDYAAWQNERSTSEQLSVHKLYWMSQFSDAVPVLKLSTDFPRPLIKTYNGSIVSFVIDADLTTLISDLSQKHSVSLFITLQACVKALLYRYTMQNDLVTGSVTAGRDHKELEDQIGYYLNTLAIRTAFHGTDSFEALLDKVKTTTLDAFEHQDYPYEFLVEDLNVVKDRSRSPLFDVMFSVQKTALENVKKETDTDFTIKDFETEYHIAKFDLTIIFSETDKELFACFEYNTDLFSSGTIQKMGDKFLLLLKQVIADPSIQLDDIVMDEVSETVMQVNTLRESFNFDF